MRSIRLGAVLGLLLLAACAPVKPPFAPTVLATTPLPELDAATLAAHDWSTVQGPLLLRLTAQFDIAGRVFPFSAMLRLDPEKGSARFVGLDDTGIKLFDLGVTCTGIEEHFLLPPLARFPGLTQILGGSVKRIYVDPAPSPYDTLKSAAGRYLLTRLPGEGETLFAFGGEPLQLLSKSASGAGENWRVDYYEYTLADGLAWPRGIVLIDDEGGYRLTLWTESVKGVP
ncbi:MAG: hypothetical protein A2005_11060 [Desulfuromonadales bacterium GWC2_61_20]|nr:MAG: hypothetical protein A2005_11060 [Desulfuromonadales bacterium GWC2_61_20]HAD04623.1 hypothetical protein [Desulfuromonas sp.]